MARQAQKLGAKVFVYYSFPSRMSIPRVSKQHDLIRQTCEEIGIKFVDALCLDSIDIGVAKAQQFILEDVPKMVAKYGQDTAFFSDACAMQMPLIRAVVETGAIYPQPCCPSFYHGFPAALSLSGFSYDGFGSISASIDDPRLLAELEFMPAVISETAQILKDKGALGRLSTWPAPVNMLMANAGAEYAIKWLNGEVPREGIDLDVLKQCMVDYAGVECFIRPYVDEDGTEYPNYLLVRQDYLTFGEEQLKGD
jgi:hypothetical protein